VPRGSCDLGGFLELGSWRAARPIKSSEYKYKTGNVRINVTMRVTADAVEEYYIFRVCVCSLSYPACNVNALYYISICGPSDPTIFFPHYLINGTIFGGEGRLIEHKMCDLIFSTNFVCNIERVINVRWPSCKVSVILFRF
jgi:hypothetical protein